MELNIRELCPQDAPILEAAFADMGWNKPAEQYLRYCDEQLRGDRNAFVAILDGEITGYTTVLWSSKYSPFREANIPEIQDLNVLVKFRNRGIASSLLDKSEQTIQQRSSVSGIGVGLHPGYNAAQRLYVKRGYVPDGRGVTYEQHSVKEGQSVIFDDELVLWLTKKLIP